MKHRVITISREFGSGGRTIGKKVAETLQIPCYDSELIQKIAQESDLQRDMSRKLTNLLKEDFWPQHFLLPVLLGRQMRIIFGRYNAR